VADKKPHELWAEAIRDVGLLFFVFGPLDTILKSAKDRESFDWVVAALIAFLGILLVAKGVELECGDDERNDSPAMGGIRGRLRVANLESQEGEGRPPAPPG
jgi:hypothetical protein